MSGDDNDISTESVSRFDDLLLAILPSLRREAMALTRHRADAEDLVHAAVTSALASQNSFEMGTNFHAWMSRILRNRFFSNIRRRHEIVDLDDAPASELARSGGQEERFAIQELSRHLLRLPANQRSVLLMISIQGLSYEEVSEQLGVAVGTVKCRVFRARTQLHLWMLGQEAGADVSDAPTRHQSHNVGYTAARSRAAMHLHL